MKKEQALLDELQFQQKEPIRCYINNGSTDAGEEVARLEALLEETKEEAVQARCLSLMRSLKFMCFISVSSIVIS